MTRCAIYTRKSSDEGLDQQFNSLDAQREACEAYIRSQKGEGWSILPTFYDDGGKSGGTMDRPALQRLLADVERGRIDVVVVYKIDRLTRSLADFARIVEAFDAREVSFVSVTQSFNTTSSMGRLTLNILLSFAQFEREVTGERIRDKIAASKAKGMWMGGLVPLGYDLPGDDRVLKVNEIEAETVRAIFERYLELRSVHALVLDLKRRGILSKKRVMRNGRHTGGQPFGRGALYHLLKNRTYRGEIVHKGTVHPGLHEAIVPAHLFDEVGRIMARDKRARHRRTMDAAPLTGKLFLADGRRLTPTHSRGSNGRNYAYYVPLDQQVGRRGPGPVLRLPARRFENLVRMILARAMIDDADALGLLKRIEIHRRRLDFTLPNSLGPAVRAKMTSDESVEDLDTASICWSVRWTWPTRGVAIEGATRSIARRDETLIRAIRAAHAMLSHDSRGRPYLAALPSTRHKRRIARLAFLSPSIQAAIIAGTQPSGLNLERLIRSEIPLGWQAQEAWVRELACG